VPNYSIEARSLGVAGVASHNFWVLRDEDGRAIAELHGLATDRETGLPVPIGTDAERFSLRQWHFPHDESYARGIGAAVDRRSYIQDGQSSQTVLIADRAEVLARWNSAVAAGQALNNLDLDYPPYGVRVFGTTVNSNSSYRTTGEIMGVAVHRFPGVMEPGVDNRMVTPESIERLRRHGYPVLTRPSVEVDGRYVEIGRSRADASTRDTARDFAGAGDHGHTALRGTLSAEQQALYDKAHAALAPGLAAKGADAQAIDRVTMGVVRHAAEQHTRGLGWPTGYALSTDGQRVLSRHGEFMMSEMSVPAALAQSSADHLASASRAEQGTVDRSQTLATEAFKRVDQVHTHTHTEPVRSYG
jgi:hypothetical protein